MSLGHADHRTSQELRNAIHPELHSELRKIVGSHKSGHKEFCDTLKKVCEAKKMTRVTKHHPGFVPGTLRLTPEHVKMIRSRIWSSVWGTVFFWLWVLVGGFAFRALELPLEKQQAFEFDETIRQMTELANLTDAGSAGALLAELEAMARNETSPDPFVAESSEVRDPDTFQERIELLTEYAFQHSNAPSLAHDGAYDWELRSACFFAFTIVTTIGYGTFAPQTWGGQVLVIPYGVIGMAIAGFVLAKNAGFVTIAFDYIMYRFASKRYAAVVACGASLSILFFYLLFWTTAFHLNPSWNAGTVDEGPWTWTESLYYCFVSVTTIGFGDYTMDVTGAGFYAHLVFIYFGVGLFTQTLMTLPGIGVVSKLLNVGASNEPTDEELLFYIVNDLDPDADDRQRRKEELLQNITGTPEEIEAALKRAGLATPEAAGGRARTNDPSTPLLPQEGNTL
jgi:hypothetical protein